MLRSSTKGPLVATDGGSGSPHASSPVLQSGGTNQMSLTGHVETPPSRCSSKALRPVASEPRLSTPSRVSRSAMQHLAPTQPAMVTGLDMSTMPHKGRQPRSLHPSLLTPTQSPRPASNSTTRPPSPSSRPPSRPASKCCTRQLVPPSLLNGLNMLARPGVLPPVEQPRSSSASGVLRRLDSQNRADEMMDKFRQLDVNGDGYLDMHDLTVLLRKGRPDITQREVAALYGKIDINNDGRVNFEEFVDYVFSSELSAKRATKRKTPLNKWEGPEQLLVDGTWGKETICALQRWLLEQRTATGSVAKAQNFISGQMNTQQVVVLQEVLVQQKMPTAIENRSTFVCGTMNAHTQRALHEFLLAEETPTAVRQGKAFLDMEFGESTHFALQELLVMYRRGRGTGLHAAR